ncbi:phasin family protein [Azospirillum brasilense]|uniref:phasin family protein n=1 Tax=Azospirillum brasilense TaxID=192 RepID=UPI00157B3F57|nr:phasin family protein [Azospirillum brasilense]
MADGTSPVHTIRSASDEAAAKTESPKTHSIRSASDEGATRSGKPEAKQPHDQPARPLEGQSFEGMMAQAGRGSGERATERSAQQFAAGGELAGRTLQDIARPAAQNLTAAMESGNVMTSRYEAACSEIVRYMQQAAQRQSEMMNDMLRARSPSDVLLAGNRYLLGGLQAFFDANGRIARSSAHTADEADRKRNRRSV